MKRIILVLILSFSFSYTFSQNKIDVLHYRFEINLNDTDDSISGKATILFVPRESTPSVSFDLKNKNANNKGMMYTGAGMARGNSPISALTHSGDKIIFTFQKPLGTGDTTSLNISYKGVPADGLIISKNKFGHRSFFADNWPNRGHNWLPCVDDPSDKAAVDFIVTAPQHYQVVANGLQLEETNLPADKKRTHWKEDVPIATKVMVIGVADFAVNLSGMVSNCIPVYSWVYPEDRDQGFYDFALANEILPFFISHVGSYGYKKLANVQSKTRFGGLENANTIFYNESLVNGKRKSEALMAHEIAHQWFGNMVTEKSFSHLWLSEGFATYMAILYMENKYGPDTARQMLLEDRQQYIDFAKKTNQPVVDETKDYIKLLNANSYQKGGWVLHMLRRQLGDSVFWKSIRLYYENFAGKNADSKDFQNIVAKTSGKDLSGYFQQWLYTPGLPELAIDWQFLTTQNKLKISIRQLQNNPFSFPLELELKNTAGSSTHKIMTISKKEETFFLPVKEKIISVRPDPRVSLLFEGTVIEK